MSLDFVISETHNLPAVFYFFSSYLVHNTTVVGPGVPSGTPGTVETGNKNRDDFHCMQMRIVMSMWLIFGDD